MTRFGYFFARDPYKPQKGTHQTIEDSCFPAWQPDERRRGNPLLESGKKESRGLPGRYSNKWSVRKNHSSDATSKFQPFPSTNDEENDTSNTTHHDDDNKQLGFFGSRGLVYHEPPKDTASAFPNCSYKDALMSQSHAAHRQASSNTSTRNAARTDTSRKSASGRARRRRQKKRKARLKRENIEEKRLQQKRAATKKQLEAADKLFHSFGIAVDGNFDDFEVEPNQGSDFFDQHESLLSISARFQDQGQYKIIDRVPRRASGPDLNAVGFEKGWTNRESNCTPNDNVGRLTTIKETRPDGSMTEERFSKEDTKILEEKGKETPRRLENEEIGLDGPKPALPAAVLDSQPTSTTWSHCDRNKRKPQPLAFVGFRGLEYDEDTMPRFIFKPNSGDFRLRGLVYNEPPKYRRLLNPISGDFRFRGLVYDGLPTTKEGLLGN